MSISLRGYQQDMIDRLRGSLGTHQRVLLQSPTGSGKTRIASHMLQRATSRGRRAMFLVHQNELIKQTSKAFWGHRLEHGLIVPGRKPVDLPLQIASIGTLVRRLDKYEPPELIVIDEAHRSVAKTYQTIVGAYSDAYVVGLTATPQRTDGRGLDEMFSDLVRGPEIRWLIDHGWLSEYKLIAPAVTFDINNVKMSGGDYDTESLEAEVNKPKITADAIEEYKKYADGKRCVVMCVNIKHARAVADAYNEAGIPAASIEGTMSGTERDQILQDFASGKIKVVTNVQLLIEGVDIPAIEAIQWLRPTQSLGIWMQGNGRTLRPFATKLHAIILDHVGNWLRHGLPDDVHEWSLAPRERRRRAKKEDEEQPVHTAQCMECFAVFLRGPECCPICGEPLPTKQIRLPEVVDGELIEIKREEARKRRRVEVGLARSIEDLVAIGFRRKYKMPAEWAVKQYTGRMRRDATPDDYATARRELKRLKNNELPDLFGEDGII